MPRLKRSEIDEPEQKDAFDIIAEGIQKGCDIPGCRPKFHMDEARYIVEKLREAKLLRES